MPVLNYHFTSKIPPPRRILTAEIKVSALMEGSSLYQMQSIPITLFKLGSLSKLSVRYITRQYIWYVFLTDFFLSVLKFVSHTLHCPEKSLWTLKFTLLPHVSLGKSPTRCNEISFHRMGVSPRCYHFGDYITNDVTESLFTKQMTSQPLCLQNIWSHSSIQS